jgi:hypothetical protein
MICGMEAIPARPTATWREVGAILLLPIGGVILPVIGWIVGVVLLWLSPRWSRGDKVIGTLVLPGGLFYGVAGLGFEAFTSSSSLRCPPSTRTSVCVTGTDHLTGHVVWGGLGFLSILVPVVLLGAVLVADGYLLWRLRGRAALS